MKKVIGVCSAAQEDIGLGILSQRAIWQDLCTQVLMQRCPGSLMECDDDEEQL